MAVVGILFRDSLGLKAGASVRWYDADESNFAGLSAPATITQDVLYQLPSAPPAVNGYVLSATTAGVMSWAAPGGGGSGEVNVGQNLGVGAPIYKGKSGVNLQFSTLLKGLDEAGQRTVDIFNTTNEVVVRAFGTVPVGAVIAWLKDLPGVPSTLPDGFTVCDGKTISDAASPLNGVTLPNLINYPPDGSHAAGAQRFLRGATSSGAAGGQDTHSHPLFSVTLCAGTGAGVANIARSDFGTAGASTLPAFYAVVWIIRYK